MLKRSKWITHLLTPFFSSVILSCSIPVYAQENIKIGALKLISHAPDFIAEEKGYFSNEKLQAQFTFYDNAAQMATAVANNTIDIGLTAITSTMVQLADKNKIRVIAGGIREDNNTNGQHILSSPSSGIKHLDDLKKLPKEKRIFGITTTGSSFYYMAIKIANKLGLSEKDIVFKEFASIPDLKKALVKGDITIWPVLPSIAMPLIQEKSAVDMGYIHNVIPDYQITVVFSSTHMIEQKRPTLEKFLHAYHKGVEDYNSALVDHKKEADSEKAAVAKYIHTFDPTKKVWAMRTSLAINKDSVEDQLHWLYKEGLTTHQVPYNTLVDSRFFSIGMQSLIAHQ